MDFGRQVHDALAHLYDLTYLQTHPLAAVAHQQRVERARGHFSDAAARIAEGLQIFRAMDDRRGITYALVGFAELAAAEGQATRAVRLFGAAAASRAMIGTYLEAGLGAEHRRVVAVMCDLLGEQAFASAWREGQAMTVEQAIAYALGDDSRNNGKTLPCGHPDR